jgi:hypothetical protein
VSRVKRHLEEQTEGVLDSVRLYGSAVLSPMWESDRYSSGWPYALLERTLAVLERQWLSGPSRESRQRLDSAAAALEEWQCPPPQDLLWDWREALEDCVEEAVEGVEQWLSPYGLRLSWETVGLCAFPEEEGQ